MYVFTPCVVLKQLADFPISSNTSKMESVTTAPWSDYAVATKAAIQCAIAVITHVLVQQALPLLGLAIRLARPRCLKSEGGIQRGVIMACVSNGIGE